MFLFLVGWFGASKLLVGVSIISSERGVSDGMLVLSMATGRVVGWDWVDGVALVV